MLAVPAMTLAIPANGDTMSVAQPDGSTVKVRVWGDEYYRRVESLDGYTLVRNSSDWICYATKYRSEDSLVATSMIYNGQPTSRSIGMPKGIDISDEVREAKIEKSRQAIWGEGGPGKEPVRAEQGQLVGVTILIDFPDDTATISLDVMKDFMNKPGFNLFGNNGSVRDYYLDVSNGKLDYRNEVVGYYRAKNPKSYYEKNNLKLVLIEEAYRSIDSTFDFTKVSYNIKAVKAVNILYAGKCQSAWGEGLWPHAGQLRFETNEGLILSNYQMAALDTGLTIGPTVHENAHMLLNLSDLYSGKGDTYGVGYYCLMCYGCLVPNPTPINAYYRSLAGWETPTDLSTIAKGTTLTQEANSMSSYVYRNPANSREGFYVESRRWGGRNTYLPDQGMMIWHVDPGQIFQTGSMTPSSHSAVSLEQADGKFDIEKKLNAGDSTDLYGGKGYDHFDSQSLPNSNWWKTTASGFSLTSISAPGKTVSFVWGDSPVSIVPYEKSTPEQSRTIRATSSELLLSSGKSISCLTIYGLDGTRLLTAEIRSTEATMIHHTLSRGMYVASYEVENNVVQQKLCIP